MKRLHIINNYCTKTNTDLSGENYMNLSQEAKLKINR